MSVDSMLISIFSVPVEALEMMCAEAAEGLAPWAWDLKPDDLLHPFSSDVRPHKSKFILYPVLTFCHLFWGLSRL